MIAEHTNGELSARCGGTSMNFVAINLAHDIVTGRRSVAQARDESARLHQAYKQGEEPPYTQPFQFPPPHVDSTPGPDTSILR